MAQVVTEAEYDPGQNVITYTAELGGREIVKGTITSRSFENTTRLSREAMQKIADSLEGMELNSEESLMSQLREGQTEEFWTELQSFNH